MTVLVLCATKLTLPSTGARPPQAEYLKPLITGQFVPRASTPRETGLHVLPPTRQGRRSACDICPRSWASLSEAAGTVGHRARGAVFAGVAKRVRATTFGDLISRIIARRHALILIVCTAALTTPSRFTPLSIRHVAESRDQHGCRSAPDQSRDRIDLNMSMLLDIYCTNDGSV